MAARVLIRWWLCVAVVLYFGAGVQAAGDDVATVEDPLQQKIDLQILGLSLEGAIKAVGERTDVPMILKYSALDGREHRPVRIDVKQLAVADVLDMICQAVDADWDEADGVVIISSATDVASGHVATRVYDVTTLMRGPGVGSLGQRMAVLESLVRGSVGRAEDWAARGGVLSSVRAYQSNLVVQTTDEHHAAIGALISEMSRPLGKMVSIEARYLLVDAAAVEAIIAGNEQSLVFDAAGAELMLKKLDGSQVAARLRTVCFSDQRVSLAANHEQGALRGGASLDVEPTVGIDGKTVMLEINSEVVISPALVGVEYELLAIRLPQGVDSDVKRAKVDALKRDTISYRTAVKVPDGGAVMLTGASGAMSGAKGEAVELVLVLRAKVSE